MMTDVEAVAVQLTALQASLNALGLKVELLTQQVQLRTEIEDKARSEARIWTRSILPIAIALGSCIYANFQRVQALDADLKTINAYGTEYSRSSVEKSINELRNQDRKIEQDLILIRNRLDINDAKRGR